MLGHTSSEVSRIAYPVSRAYYARAMNTRRAPLVEVYDALFEHFGPQHWWPGRTRLEVCVGAILTQNTSWTNVAKSIERLREQHALTLTTMARTPHPVLADWIRPAGYFNVKARRLHAFVRMVEQDFGGSLRRLFALDTKNLRARLLSVNGIGPETADSIVLYAAERPVFVVDAYTRRMLERHRWIAPGASYDEMVAVFTNAIEADTQVFNEYHALIVNLGKTYCRPTPRCDECPLKRWLPASRR
jgi:endonuclease-3 related protein